MRELLALGPLGTVLGTALHTAVDALGIQRTTDDVVTDAGQVLDTAAADHDDGVFLQVVADTGDVSGDFVTIAQAHTGDLTQCGVGLFGGCGTNSGADTSLLGRRLIGLSVLQSVLALLQCGGIGLVDGSLSALTV